MNNTTSLAADLFSLTIQARNKIQARKDRKLASQVIGKARKAARKGQVVIVATLTTGAVQCLKEQGFQVFQVECPSDDPTYVGNRFQVYWSPLLG